MSGTQSIDFLYFDAGGGHRSAATALQSVLASRQYPWDVRLVNLQEVLDPLDVFRKVTGVRLQDMYNFALMKGWTLGSEYILPVMHGFIRLYHSAQVKLLTEFWRGRGTDMVVSLIPNFGRAVYQSLQHSAPDTPLVTILTDFADYPPHFWFEKQPQHYICGTSRAVEQAAALGHPPERLLRVSGMILRPQFYEPQCSSREAEREKLGLRPDVPTGLVLFGGEGSGVMWPLANRLGNSDADLQLIMICGRNASLRRRLQALRTRNPIFVEGFTGQIPYYMHLSDFFIGKPGPGSISEALKMKLPVILERNSWTLPQERYNARWVEEQGVGTVLENFRDIESAVKLLLSTGRMAQMRQRIECLDNQAVFEIPAILENILATRASRSELFRT